MPYHEHVMKARIRVSLKPTVLDAQGAVVRQALQSLGYENVADVRMGKYIEVELADTADVDRQVREMCERLLTNPIIENYEYEVSA